MIADFLSKGLAWARSFFWVSDADHERERSSSPAAQKQGAAARGQQSGKPTSTARTGAERRPAAAKTSTNKRGASGTARASSTSGTAKSGTAKSGAAKSGTAKSGGAKAGAAKGKQTTGTKSSGPGQPEADPAKPGDLTEIKGIGPAMKTKLGALGIKSFADLAGANADQVAKNLGSRTITPERVRGWIAEAKKRS